MTLKEFNERYEQIIHSTSLTEQQKGVLFGDLMSRMERTYKIPMLRNEEWEQNNKNVIALYRKISISRNLD